MSTRNNFKAIKCIKSPYNCLVEPTKSVYYLFDHINYNVRQNFYNRQVFGKIFGNVNHA